MAGTRSSARLNSSPQSAQSDKSATGTKRKADDSSPSSKAKRGRPSKASKEQKTIEETAPVAVEETETKKDETKDTEMKDIETKDAEIKETETETDDTKAHADGVNGDTKDHANGEDAAEGAKDDESKEDTIKEDEANKGQESAFDLVKATEGEDGKTTAKSTEDTAEAAETTDVKADAVKEDKEREKASPSNVLEKGIIYFFTRGRVGIEDPQKVADLQRSYFVLRPLPDGARLTDGAIQDIGNNRLIALPKKVWPKSGKDRFMVFVEKAKASMANLKEEFFQGSTYETQTAGTRHLPEVTPLGEGVYSITAIASSGSGAGTNHLAYMLTIPSKPGDVQNDVGLAEKGSFIISVKNPEASTGSASVQLPQGAEFPREIIDEFQNRAWGPAEPKHMDYTNCAMLMIGEDFDNSSNLEPTDKDKKDDSKVTPQEELEQLEHEDELRVEQIKGDNTIFEDLGISSKEYPQVMTTW